MTDKEVLAILEEIKTNIIKAAENVTFEPQYIHTIEFNLTFDE